MPEKILIVDDDIDSLKLIGLMLQRNNYEVIVANSGSQALAKAEAEIPDLIILDVMMPDMNGYDVCRRLRNIESTKAIPIIMFTAKTLIDDKVAGFEAGADDYLTKPTHPAELASRVKAILERTIDRRSKSSTHGMTIGVLGAKGGVGTTTLALNIGAALKQLGENPIVTDFRLGNGTLGLMMGFSHPEGIGSLLEISPDELDSNIIQKELVSHQTGLRALLSSTHPRESLLEYSPEGIANVIRGLNNIAKPVIVDLGSGYTPLIDIVQHELQQLVVLVEPSSIGVTLAYDLLEELSKSFQGHIHIVVVHRTPMDVAQTSWQDVENALNRQIRAIISAAPDLVFEASDAGVPIVNFQPNAIISGEITKLAQQLNNKPHTDTR